MPWVRFPGLASFPIHQWLPAHLRVHEPEGSQTTSLEMADLQCHTTGTSPCTGTLTSCLELLVRPSNDEKSVKGGSTLSAFLTSTYMHTWTHTHAHALPHTNTGTMISLKGALKVRNSYLQEWPHHCGLGSQVAVGSLCIFPRVAINHLQTPNVERETQGGQLDCMMLRNGKQSASLMPEVSLSQTDTSKSSHREKERVQDRSEGSADEME